MNWALEKTPIAVPRAPARAAFETSEGSTASIRLKMAKTTTSNAPSTQSE